MLLNACVKKTERIPLRRSVCVVERVPIDENGYFKSIGAGYCHCVH
jgi:hypothetical protein